MVIEVLRVHRGLGLGSTRVRVHHKPLMFGVGPDMLGRIFNSLGEPIDGGPPIVGACVPARGRRGDQPVVARPAPRLHRDRRVTTIDLMNSLVRGQKLPLFSGGGLPHDRMATEIAQRARLRGEEAGRFAVVFVGIGVSHDTAESFRGHGIGRAAAHGDVPEPRG